VPEQFTYFHVEIASYELLMSEGVPVESFVGNADRMNFQNWSEYEALGNTGPIPEMCYLRAKSARQLPSTLRHLLAERAEVLCKRLRYG
jgi:hypothetical protein